MQLEEYRTNENSILRMEEITKRFVSVIALNKVNFELRKGEVHGIVGENGAGKSTLIKILSGMYRDYEGKIYINGIEKNIFSPRHSIQEGISVIFQEFNLVPDLTVSENVFLGDELIKSRFLGLLDYNQMRRKTKELFDNYNLSISPEVKVKRLGIAQAQIVEIIKALRKNSRIIVMDEPTAALTMKEAGALFETIKDLKEKGISIIFISHRLEEIFEVCDRVTVLKDGKVEFIGGIQTINYEQLIEKMIGKEITEFKPTSHSIEGNELLRVENLYSQRLKNISFTLRTNEVLGIIGRTGSGRTQLLRTIFGAQKIERGRILLDGIQVNITSPKDAIARGIGFLTEDRKNLGLILLMTIAENITLAILRLLSNFFIVNHKKVIGVSVDKIEELKIKTTGAEQRVVYLSGGNQQKVILARWLCSNSNILLFDEPTRGIDVATKFEIYRIIDKLREKGKGIIISSSDLDEVFRICDRVIILQQGKIVHISEKSKAIRSELLSYVVGNKS